MKKFKTYVSLILTILFIVPCMFIFSACGKKVNKLSCDELSLVVSGGNFKKGTTLDAHKVEKNTRDGLRATASVEGKDYNTELELYIISLEASLKNKTVQPNGNVTISMPAPYDSAYGYVVFQVFDDNSTSELDVTEKDGNISFVADSLSLFVVAGQREDFFLFEISMEKSDSDDENIQVAALYSLREPSNKASFIKTKIDGLFNSNSKKGLNVYSNNIEILTSTGYKNCVIGNNAKRKGAFGYYTYTGSFTAKMSVNKNYEIFYIENVTNVLTKVDTTKSSSQKEGRYFIAKKSTYNNLLKSGVKNDGTLYNKLAEISSAKTDESGNTTYEDVTASYEIWIQFSTNVKTGKA